MNYSHGLPFDKTLAVSIDALRDRIERKKSAMIIIDGGLGEGKTTLAVHIADYYNNREISFKDQYSMGGDKFQEQLYICHEKGLPVIIYDESGDFSKRGALTKFNQRLNRVFETFRAFKILVILVLPNFNVLENQLLENKVPRMLINCHSRNRRQGNYRVYSLYRMHYIKHKMTKLVVKEYAYTQVTPNFRGHYLDLDPERSQELDRIGSQGKLEIITENVLEAKGLISIQGLCKRLQRSDIWIRGKLKKLKIKEQVIHKRRKYYDALVLDFLRNELQRG